MAGYVSSDTTIHLIRAADLRAEPWKNGGGITRQIASSPVGAGFDTFLWRISLAEVAQEGMFSTFSTIDRVLTVTQGAALGLKNTDTGHIQMARQGQPVYFAGEDPVCALLPDGPVHDHNLMWRRDQAQGRTEVHRNALRLALAAGDTVLHCASGAYHIIAPTHPIVEGTLEQGDSLVLAVNTTSNMVIDIKPLLPSALLLNSHIRLLLNPNRPESDT